jgi:magnesium transporter
LIQGISASHESILSNRSNELVKFLTVITSISFPFVIVNNLYSMNVKGLPYSDAPWIVPALFLIIFAGGVAIVSYFKYRDWL